MIFYRERYRFPQWKIKIGWPDGFARGVWTSDRAAVENGIAAVKAKGGEAFLEMTPRAVTGH
jgi:hypothetical protein